MPEGAKSLRRLLQIPSKELGPGLEVLRLGGQGSLWREYFGQEEAVWR